MNGGGNVSGNVEGGRSGEGRGKGGRKGKDGINGEDPDSGGVSKYGELPSVSAPGPIVTGPDGRIGFWAISIQGQPMFIPTPTVS